ATSAPSPLSLHDALPICIRVARRTTPSVFGGGTAWRVEQSRIGPTHRREARDLLSVQRGLARGRSVYTGVPARAGSAAMSADIRSEEHTSELQSRENLVC